MTEVLLISYQNLLIIYLTKVAKLFFKSFDCKVQLFEFCRINPDCLLVNFLRIHEA